MNFKDWTGIEQGNLTVLKREGTVFIGKQGGSSPRWKCRCNICGEIVYYSSRRLKLGVSDCGKHGEKSIKISVGDRFGILEVIEIIKTDKPNKMYKCKCDCGNTTIRHRSYLLKSKNPNCGCVQKEPFISEKTRNMVGKEYGDLKVLELIPKENHVTYAKCQCMVCGNITYPVASAVRNGRIKSCRHVVNEFLEKGKEITQIASVEGTNLFSIQEKRKTNKNNKSGHRGVSFQNKTQKWRAYINFRRKQYHLGLYDNINDAIKAREDAEREIYGNFRKWYAETYPEKWEKLQRKKEEESEDTN